MRERRTARSLLLATSALVPLGLLPAYAGPQGGQVVGGSSTISTQGSTTTITQTTDRSAINWQTYNVGAGEKVQYIQPNANSVSLNRVVGGLGPSSIYGNITANGQVWIINPAGILIGSGAVVNTAGFLATTNDIKNDDFMAGRYNFIIPGRPDASVVNLGTITATNGGFAALVAPGVRNSGTITAKFGKIALASGNTFSLDFYGDGLITLGVNDSIAGQVKDVATGETLKSLVTNDGTLKANGGRVELTAVSARQVVDSVINTSGVIEARSIGHRNGMIVLGAQTSKTKVAGSPTQTVKVSGTLNVSGKKKGGTVKVTGENIQLASANINATGGTAGGTVMIGGDTGGGHVSSEVASLPQAQLSGGPVPTADTVSVDANSVIDVSATKSGNGGKAIVWSDLHTVFAGTVLAKGGAQSGNGGFVEVSGKQTLAYSGKVDTRAVNGAFGTLLLDPYNLEISYGVSSGMSGFNANANSSVLNVGDLVNALTTSNVVVTTSNSGGVQAGDITVSTGITWSTPTVLTLNASHNIVINAAINATNGGLTLIAGNEITTGISGDVTVAKFTLQSGNWIQNSANLPLFSTYDFRILGTASFLRAGGGNGTISTPYQIVDIYGLQGIGSTGLLNKYYALQNNIDASYTNLWNSGAGFVPIGGNSSSPFTGQLDGQGFAISNLTIAPTSATVSQIGLFGVIGSTGVVKDLALTSASITANTSLGSSYQYVGVLAGTNYGTINGVSATGTISGGSLAGLVVGGLVGQNGAVVSGSTFAGTIQNSSANVAITTGNGVQCLTLPCSIGGNMVGGLVGYNPGTISASHADGAIVVGSNTMAGGLVGTNQFLNDTAPPQPVIENSWATGSVSSSGLNVQLGGLVGYNWGTNGTNILSSAIIRNSRATGNVTASAALSNPNCVFNCDVVSAGGLVGFNQGSIVGTVAANVSNVNLDPSLGVGTYATGTVNVGSGGTAGGLAGQNDGIIDKALATGIVIGAAGLNDNRSTTLGGFVGQSNGLITNSLATGDVGSAGIAYLQVGGFAGRSGGTIGSSQATGNVETGNNSSAGGFAGDSAPSDHDNCNGCNRGVGYNNLGAVTDSSATGAVTVGSVSAAGGFVAFSGSITNSTASGAVTGDSDSVLGGFAAVIPTLEIIGNSHASGSVTSNGANTWIGGFAGINAGFISLSSSATGSVQATSDSVVGGFVGVNIGQITAVETHGFYTLTPQVISVSGNNNIVGGLVGANFGAIVSSTSLAAITGNASNTMGTLVGANGNIANVAPGQVFGSTFPLGTIINSTGSGTINSAAGPEVGTYNLAKLPTPPAIIQQCDDTLCEILKNPKLIEAPKQVDPDLLPDDVFATALILSLLSTDNKAVQAAIGQALISLPATDSAPSPGNAGNNSNGSTGTRTVSQTPGAPPSPPPPPPLRPVSGPDGERFSSIPPINETRFLQNEVVLQMGINVPLADVQRIAQSMGLSIISQQSLNALGRNAFRFNISGGRSVRDVIRALEANSIVAVAQPNYQYKLSQADAPASEHKGDPAQYMVDKLQLEQVHRLASGKNVTVAVIDSEADKQHTELQGQIAEQFNAVGEAEKAHSHGTAMVGAISSRDRLLGVAPGAKILAVRAFSESQQSAEGTTYNILKSIDWAVSQGARVINMSFAGPRDPSLERTLKKAYDQGVVLIAAAGNAGPKSPPLYPGADPSVIAVTATDVADRGFKMANQGPYVSVASPGVDVLAPAPQESYQMSTGTSIATAHVSGVVALMLERDPTLTPADVRRILEATATDLGPKGKDTQFGWGLVNPQKALQMVDERKRKLTEVQPAATTGSR
ncbi:MAG: S8 family serine peptidase [Pseudomonadota bacterium]